ncbi:MAG: hypothetical protein Q9169_004447 [Polycauliona sp. 2 TL-2023]
MLNFISPALLAITACHSAAATPVLNPADPMTLSAPNSNLAVVAAGLGARELQFNVRILVPGTQILNLDDGLMAVTKTLHRLSGLYYNGRMGPTTYVALGYTSVTVEIRAVPGQSNIMTRYALWGALAVGGSILQRREVRNHVFGLFWSNTVVAYIQLKRTTTAVQLSLAGGSQEDDSSSSARQQRQLPDQTQDINDTVNNNKNNRNDSPINPPLQQRDDETEIGLKYHVNTDQPMTKWELFANIYNQLGYIAEFAPRQRRTGIWSIRPALFPNTQSVIIPAAAGGGVEYR